MREADSPPNRTRARADVEHRRRVIVALLRRHPAGLTAREIAEAMPRFKDLADQVTPGELEQGLLFPPQSNILETEIKVAARVAKVVFDSDLARVKRPADYEAFIRSHVYKPEYRSYV